MKYIFLDFDGVLHSTNYDTLEFELVPMLAKGLSPYSEKFVIIISSLWRQNHSLEFLINIFPPSIKRNIKGITPTHLNGLSRGGRFNEIKEYCQSYHIKDSDWIAIDDNASLFPPQCTNLVLTATTKGITEKELAKLIEFVNS